MERISMRARGLTTGDAARLLQSRHRPSSLGDVPIKDLSLITSHKPQLHKFYNIPQGF